MAIVLVALPYPCLTPEQASACTAWQAVQTKPMVLLALALPVALLAAALAWLVNRQQTLLQTHPENYAQLAATVFQSTQEAILITDRYLNIITVNPAFSEITGFSLEEVVGRQPRFHRSGQYDERFYEHIWSCIRKTDHWQGEIWNRRKNGELFPAWENVSSVRNSHGTITHYVSLMSDISAIKQVEERLNHLAHHDPLTELHNRLAYTSHLESALERAKRHATKVALLLLDLDRFKHINDTLGHATGDLVLTTIAERLRRCVRGEDMVARLGGDEFTIVLEGISHGESAGTLAQKITRTVNEPMWLGEHEIAMSTSIGIAIYPDDASEADALAQAADTAMYRAKSHGRNSYEFFTPEMVTHSQWRLAIESALRHALEQNELSLYYQPLYNLNRREIVGLEALVRWHHPQWGLLLPDQFIEIAEETGLIDGLGDWVINTACAQLAEWHRMGGKPLRLSVNVSGHQLINGHLLETLQSSLLVHELEPSEVRFGLDITENMLQAGDDVLKTLRRLRAWGANITIDDFGSGYSSLRHLKDLPVDALKIDPVFLKDIPFDTDNYAIAAAIISMGQSLGMNIIAEGVETTEQLAFLELHGCDEVQGYLIGKPMPAEQATRLMRDNGQGYFEHSR
ncbi:putative bifunctional diguanylate cyclase/phosphodiesterase [Saccharospirillum salsuginis]|nr:EAL domain-containing protein [Saccharospirillum salsuginis]